MVAHLNGPEPEVEVSTESYDHCLSIEQMKENRERGISCDHTPSSTNGEDTGPQLAHHGGFLEFRPHGKSWKMGGNDLYSEEQKD